MLCLGQIVLGYVEPIPNQCNLMQPFRGAVCWYLAKIEKYSNFTSTNTLEKLSERLHKATCSRTFMAALFFNAENWKRPHWPPIRKHRHEGVTEPGKNEWSELVWINLKNSVDRWKLNCRIIFFISYVYVLENTQTNAIHCLAQIHDSVHFWGGRDEDEWDQGEKNGGCQFYLHCFVYVFFKIQVYTAEY